MDDEIVLKRRLDGTDEPKDLPLALLQKITNQFSSERKIGQGGFGAVYKGELGSVIVAVKRIYVNLDKLGIDDKLFDREFNSLWKITHENVVRFLGFCSNTYQTPIKDDASGEIILANVRERLFCFEFISGGSLDKHITDELRGLEWETRYEIITGICKGLCYLHKEKNIVHMDLKPENILLNDLLVPKITDFGLSRPNKNSHTKAQPIGTRGYIAPEYMEDSKTTPACDIYSLGLIIIELITGNKEVPHENNVLRRWRHRWNNPPTPLQYQQVTGCIDIAVRCRKQDPKARPSINEIIELLSESTDGHTGQEISSYMDDEMLGIEPLELRFTSELNNEMAWSVKLANKTKSCFAFNIERPSQQYTIRPDKGIVPPECNEYIIQITLRPQERAPQVIQNADTLIVRSRTVSNGFKVEDITEHIVHEGASEVIDEVNLMVLYEATKLCNSEKIEAASSDINSSGRGQCGGQTEQCNLLPLQSFSRYYRTNRKYLGKESDRDVDLARGAMGSLLDKLGKLVTEDYNLEKSMKRDIESFSKVLRNMHRDLPKLENVDEAKIWVDEVRELSYHIEDMVDSFLVHVEPDSNRSGFRELTHEGLNLLVNGLPTHNQIDDVIKDIKILVQDVADRKEEFDVSNVVAYATADAYIDDLRNLAIYEDKEDLIGIEVPRNKLIKLFEDDNVSQQNLKIISIVGLGGLGKTTLAKAVYDKLQAQYHTRAFVPVGRNPDVKDVLKNIIFEVEKDFHAENLDVRQLIRKLNELLQNKRYFIVIDDLWDSEASLPSQKKEAWSIIKYAFPRNKHGSRVITTTRNYDVALACCNAESKYVYAIKPLSVELSRRLFFRRTFGPEKDCPNTLLKEEISTDILKICGGMPLAINSIASLLAGKPETTWEYVRKTLGALTEGNAALDNMKQILDLSYIHLPDHLKTCLLYVCMYPEDREIDKNDLLRQWIAEGFVHVSTNSRLDAEDVAENYFKMLINMCMIQPGKIDYNNQVLSCRVHDIILDLMRSKSSQVNFVHVIDGSKDETGLHGELRRVSVHSNDEEDMRIFETLKNKDPLQHVRSVLLYRSSLVPYFLGFNYVRVLHIEYKGFSGDLLDLTGISRLFLLRYLKVSSSGKTYGDLKLPDKIGELQQLETIDIQRCGLHKYPADIGSLPRLSHLIYVGGFGLRLPDGVSWMRFLRTLVGVCVFSTSLDVIKGLGELTNLRNLGIHWVMMARSIEEVDVRMEALQSSISRLHTSLKILTIRSNIFFCNDHNLRCWSSWSRSLFAQGSHIEKLDLRGHNFHRCPEWIGQLHNLYSFRIQVREVADGLSIVAGLPSLAYFCLFIDNLDEEREESARFSGSRSFTALKHLRFRCKKASLTFEEGALPKLEKLEILFCHHMTRRSLPVGIEHLPARTIKEISLRVSEKKKKKNCMANKFSLHWHRNKLIEDKKELRIMLKRAFKVHHPGADISVHFEQSDFYEEFDEVEEFHCVNDEGDYREEEDYEKDGDEEDDKGAY